MNNNVWVMTKSGNWYKTNFQKDIREVTRVVTHTENSFIPCTDSMGRETYLNTKEVECVTDFK